MGVMHFDFMSDKLGYQTNIYVTLPECMERGEAPKGILYLLHGGGGNGLDWIRNTAIERYAQPYELAVIMPEVDGSCFYADMKHGYPYFQYLTREVPAAMEGMLPLLRGVEKRYVAGLSMGGYGAFKWAFNEPEYFMAAANLSGVSFVVDLMADDSHGLNGKESLIECNWGSLEELKGSEWEEAAKRNVAFFTVGAKLMDDSVAVTEDVKQVVQKWSGIVGNAQMPLKSYLKNARLSLGGDNKLMMVVEDGLPYDYLKQEGCKEQVERLIEDYIGKSVEITLQAMDGGKQFENSYIDLAKIINIEIEEED